MTPPRETQPVELHPKFSGECIRVGQAKTPEELLANARPCVHKLKGDLPLTRCPRCGAWTLQ